MAVNFSIGNDFDPSGGVEHPVVLSVQSHVIHGFVGNKIAGLLLPLLGTRVDVVNTVHFVSQFIHTGPIMSEDVIASSLDSLTSSGLNKYNLLLTGFIGNAGSLRALINYVKTIRSSYNPNFSWICDPVLGDHGRIYVDKELIKVYTEEAFKFADVITPNHHELQWLCDFASPPSTEKEVFDGCSILHQKGVPLVIVTSYPDESDLVLALSFAGSIKNKKIVKSDNLFQYKIKFKKIETKLYGTGDSFAASLASSLLSLLNSEDAVSNDEVLKCVERALNITHTLITETLNSTPAGKQPVNIDLIHARQFLYHADDIKSVAIERKLISE